MANANWIRDTMKVYSEIMRKTGSPSFKFSQGGATFRAIDKFLDMFTETVCLGNLTPGRIVDFCICTAHAYKNRRDWTVKQVFGPSSIRRLKESKHGARYYEDEWLKENGMTRQGLIDLIADRSQHPLSKYIFMQAEEPTKLRYLNEETGYILCQTSTLGWSPVSEACVSCTRADSCKRATEGKFPELYRIRVEYGEAIKQCTD